MIYLLSLYQVAQRFIEWGADVDSVFFETATTDFGIEAERGQEETLRLVLEMGAGADRIRSRDLRGLRK